MTIHGPMVTRILMSLMIGERSLSIGARRSRVVRNVMAKQTTQMTANSIIVRGHPRLSCSCLSWRYSIMAGVSASVGGSGGFAAASAAAVVGTLAAGGVTA